MSCGAPKWAPEDGFPAMCKESKDGIAAVWNTTGVNVACAAPACAAVCSAPVRGGTGSRT
jgi:hypothetical protein